jgi:condensin complex subunit 3
MLSKRFDDQLKDFSEEEYRKLEDLQELFTYLDDVIPLDDEDEEPPRRRTAQKRWV